MQKYSDCPQVVRDFLVYHESIKGQSQRTISEYYLDLRMFFRFIKLMRCDMPIHTRLDDIPIKDIDLQFIKEITTSDIYDFLSYLAHDRTPDPDAAVPEYGISPAARARKLAALKSFYKYLTVRTKQLTENPVADLEYPKLRKSLPKYLTLEQSSALLMAVSGQNQKRDYAILMLNPKSGAYFSATKGYLELDICEGKIVADVDEFCRPMKETHEETTLAGAGRIAEIAAAVHANGGKVIANINVVLAWLPGNVEPYVDALTLGYDTYPSAILDVYFGRFSPVGKLPITMPRGDEVLAVNADGVCISPNDVPGYDKDLYMPDSLKDENGKAYAYRDVAGNYYEMDFGLTY